MFIGAVGGAGAAAYNSDDPSILLVGILAGAVLGQVLEDSMNTHSAILYTLRSQNGAELKAVKLASDGDQYELGDRVRVHYGHPPKLEKIGQSE
jgi:outer membrane lipoprotein SlyB